MHRRLRPVAHRFAYRISALFLDIDCLADTARESRLLSYNRPNLFSFYDEDHGNRDGRPLRPWVDEKLGHEDVVLGHGQVMLFCMPRMFGYVFNPLSVYFCFREDGRLAALIYEVKNTFGEQHSYVVPVAPDERQGVWRRHERDKKLFVSPFIGMAARYRFRVAVPDERLRLFICEADEEGDFMIATLTTRRSNLDDWALALALVRDPMMTFKVIGAIHWQALRLWIKRVPIHSHGSTPPHKVS